MSDRITVFVPNTVQKVLSSIDGMQSVVNWVKAGPEAQDKRTKGHLLTLPVQAMVHLRGTLVDLAESNPTKKKQLTSMVRRMDSVMFGSGPSGTPGGSREEYAPDLRSPSLAGEPRPEPPQAPTSQAE